VIYPNPAQGVLYVEAVQGFSSYRLMDASMRVVRSAQFGMVYQQKVDVRELSNGIYFLQVGNGKLKKVVIQH
jgi:hypothetical protein